MRSKEARECLLLWGGCAKMIMAVLGVWSDLGDPMGK